VEQSELKDEQERLEAEIADLEGQVDELETADSDEQRSEFVEAHQRLTELERERGRLESQLSDATADIEELEETQEERKAAEEELGTVTDELKQLRGRIEQLEERLVETLNELLADLLEVLSYRNIARVWVEQKLNEDATGRSAFQLHVVREDESGTVYRDSVETLSESEQEVIGLVIALAGYLVHHVDSEIPFLLIDSVEMIDGDRLAELLGYIRTQCDVQYLLIALLSKDARAVENAGIPGAPVAVHTDPFG